MSVLLRIVRIILMTKQEEEQVRERSPARSLSPRSANCKKRRTHPMRLRKRKKRHPWRVRSRRYMFGDKKKVSWKDPLVEYRVFDNSE